MIIGRKGTLIILSICGLFFTAFGQSVKKSESELPTVYLEFEPNRSDLKNGSTTDENQVLIRLRNRSRWGIRLETSGDDRVFGNTKLFYDTLKNADTVERTVGCHVCTFTILRPGKSLVFGVPKQHLAKAYALRLKFSYQWEDVGKVFGGREPTHYVFLYLDE